MKSFLALPAGDRDRPEMAIGIPVDSLNNQFKVWMQTARQINRDLRIAIKSDQETPYKVIKDIMGTLQDIRENKYNLITSLESVPKTENE